MRPKSQDINEDAMHYLLSGFLVGKHKDFLHKLARGGLNKWEGSSSILMIIIMPA